MQLALAYLFRGQSRESGIHGTRVHSNQRMPVMLADAATLAGWVAPRPEQEAERRSTGTATSIRYAGSGTRST